MKTVNDNIFNTNCEYIMHQVNCLGIAGAGLAKQIRDRHPDWFEAYKLQCKLVGSLGDVQVVSIGDEKYKGIINVFGQFSIGASTQQTSYIALTSAFQKLKNFLPERTTIAIPYKMSCGLAGGDWNKVLKIIEEQLDGYFDITIYKKD